MCVVGLLPAQMTAFPVLLPVIWRNFRSDNIISCVSITRRWRAIDPLTIRWRQFEFMNFSNYKNSLFAAAKSRYSIYCRTVFLENALKLVIWLHASYWYVAIPLLRIYCPVWCATSAYLINFKYVYIITCCWFSRCVRNRASMHCRVSMNAFRCAFSLGQCV